MMETSPSESRSKLWKPFDWRRIIVLGLAAIGAIFLFRQQVAPAGGFLLSSVLVGILLLPISLNPLTARKLHRFKSIRRGYISLLVLVGLTLLSLFAELLANNKALVVRFDDSWHFPVYGRVLLGAEFDLEGEKAVTPVNYRELKEQLASSDRGFVLMPPITYGPNENLTSQGIIRARAPNWAEGHYLGTDGAGRDILSRLIYGFRIAVFFALAFTLLVYLIGVFIGCLMGYFGGWFDLVGQRLIEIWSLIPFLYVVIILFSTFPTSLPVSLRVSSLLVIMVIFSWTQLTYYMRTATYREKTRDYVSAARVLGAGTGRIVFSHILPNAISTVVTFMPFMMSSAITAITALDFLGFGLPPPTPSLGEMLKQGSSNLNSPWIVSSAFGALVILLSLVTFVGEAMREAFDPRKFTYYR